MTDAMMINKHKNKLSRFMAVTCEDVLSSLPCPFHFMSLLCFIFDGNLIPVSAHIQGEFGPGIGSLVVSR